MAGIYAGIVPGIIGSLFARTVTVTTLTSAIALTSRSVLGDAGLDPTDPANAAPEAAELTAHDGAVGPDGIVEGADEVLGAGNAAVSRGRDWIAGRPFDSA